MKWFIKRHFKYPEITPDWLCHPGKKWWGYRPLGQMSGYDSGRLARLATFDSLRKAKVTAKRLDAYWRPGMYTRHEVTKHGPKDLPAIGVCCQCQQEYPVHNGVVANHDFVMEYCPGSCMNPQSVVRYAN